MGSSRHFSTGLPGAAFILNLARAIGGTDRLKAANPFLASVALGCFFMMLSMDGSTEPLVPASSALDRPALQVQSPEQQVMQAVVQAGKRLVAVGERGIIILSDDGGTTWRQARQVPASVTLTQAAFLDGETGWAVGHGGVVLRTRDGGESWAKEADGVGLADIVLRDVKNEHLRRPDDPRLAAAFRNANYLVDEGADKPLLDIAFKDRDKGWMAGAYNLFFETHDGGKTWLSAGMRLDNPQALHLYAVRVRENRVLVVGEQGLIYLSEDGGRTFDQLESPYDGTWFTAAILPNGSLVIAGLRGNAYRSDDSGQSWRKLTHAPPVSFVAAADAGDGGVVLANQAGQLFRIKDEVHLYALSASTLPPLTSILHLGGKSWIATTLGGIVYLTQNEVGEAE